MKEMIYSPHRKREILHSGEYNGYKFCILNLGTHPTAYVECKLVDCCSYDDRRFENISVHGGFTFLADFGTTKTIIISAGTMRTLWTM